MAENVFPQFVDRFGSDFPTEWRRICERAIRSWAKLFIPRIIEGKAITLTRGDAHQENLFLPFNRQAHRPIWIDWETVVCGIGLYDLVYMLFHATDFDIEMRRKVENGRIYQLDEFKYPLGWYLSVQDDWNEYQNMILTPNLQVTDSEIQVRAKT